MHIDMGETRTTAEGIQIYGEGSIVLTLSDFFLRFLHVNKLFWPQRDSELTPSKTATVARKFQIIHIPVTKAMSKAVRIKR